MTAPRPDLTGRGVTNDRSSVPSEQEGTPSESPGSGFDKGVPYLPRAAFGACMAVLTKAGVPRSLARRAIGYARERYAEAMQRGAQLRSTTGFAVSAAREFVAGRDDDGPVAEAPGPSIMHSCEARQSFTTFPQPSRPLVALRVSKTAAARSITRA